jgi:uncharacterized repeat protein (TIGR03806 family)
MPDNVTAQYHETEIMDLPVGTILIKTFALPADTSVRGKDNETLIETRLLIHRESGWRALPYKWNSSETSAELVLTGRTMEASLVHDGETLTFDYKIPSTTECKECHQLLETDVEGNAIAGSGVFAPIGPKARFLNYDIDYGDAVVNQLTHWQSKGMLENVPEALAEVDSSPEFHDNQIAAMLTLGNVETINKMARGYLDINCAHCHRPTGSANNYGLYLEYHRELSVETGVCKSAIAPPGNSAIETSPIRDIVPGVPAESLLYERISSTDGGLKIS